MRNDLGTYNSNSHYNRSLRAANIDRLAGQTIYTDVTPSDVERLRFFVKGQLSVAQYHGIAVRIREFQAQLKLLEGWTG